MGNRVCQQINFADRQNGDLQKAILMWDMTNNKIKVMKYLQNTEDNKTNTTRCLPPPGHARRWYIIKFFLWEISNI
jgi:hypothetical protein